MEEPGASLSLWDYRRRMADLYRTVRNSPPAEATWRHWRSERDALFATHPQSALDAGAREGFGGLTYFPYDPAWRLEAVVQAAEGREVSVAHSVWHLRRTICRWPSTPESACPSGDRQLARRQSERRFGGSQDGFANLAASLREQ